MHEIRHQSCCESTPPNPSLTGTDLQKIKVIWQIIIYRLLLLHISHILSCNPYDTLQMTVEFYSNHSIYLVPKLPYLKWLGCAEHSQLKRTTHLCCIPAAHIIINKTESSSSLKINQHAPDNHATELNLH